MKHRDIAFRAGNIVLFRHYRKKVKIMISLAKNRYISRVNSLSSRNDWTKVKEIANLKKEKLCESHTICLLYTSPSPRD